jgi:hypothetical protein
MSPSGLAEVCCACLPVAGLPDLAALRARPELRVLPAGERVWAFWPAGEEALVRQILAVRGAELFARRGGAWFRQGAHLPSFAVPDPAGAAPLAGVLVPEPVRPEQLNTPFWAPVSLTLVRDGQPRPASALVCGTTVLAGWVERATSHQLSELLAARTGEEVLLLGERLPPVPGMRYWGRDVLAPLGWRPEPAVGEAVLREVLGLGEDELALLGARDFEVIPRAALAPLTRGGARRAIAEGRP